VSILSSERKKLSNMKTVVFYDSLCGVCNYWVNWILENDTKEVFYFVALESDFATQFSHHFNYEFPTETIVIWDEHEGFFKKSDAVIYILLSIKESSFPAKALRFFPKILRDWGYSIFAYFRRYIKLSKCKIPSSEERTRFLTNQSFQVFLNKCKD
jgi:predicted DCC family thiol-disulfide oxidoreductase YuxK